MLSNQSWDVVWARVVDGSDGEVRGWCRSWVMAKRGAGVEGNGSRLRQAPHSVQYSTQYSVYSRRSGGVRMAAGPVGRSQSGCLVFLNPYHDEPVRTPGRSVCMMQFNLLPRCILPTCTYSTGRSAHSVRAMFIYHPWLHCCVVLADHHSSSRALHFPNGPQIEM